MSIQYQQYMFTCLLFFLKCAPYLYSTIFIYLILFRHRVKEYLPITGLADFNKLSAELIFGYGRYLIFMVMVMIFDCVHACD